ncbi:MAG: hypothetical protein OEY14_02730 [Myxococcales bacterium]|nr:hypothetical protein [Myxococcales bacterium]
MRHGLLLLLALLIGCAAISDDMLRAQEAYEQSEYDDALVWLSDLEDDSPDMDLNMRARFYFLRGMTAYRLGKRTEALHYLAVCREITREGAVIEPSWQEEMEELVTELTPLTATFRAREASETSGGEAPGAASADAAAAGSSADAAAAGSSDPLGESAH